MRRRARGLLSGDLRAGDRGVRVSSVMHVAHVLRKYDPREWGGTETAIEGLLAGLQAHAVRSVVYAPRLPAQVEDDPLAAAGHEVRRYRAFLPTLGLPREERTRRVAVGGNLVSFDLAPRLWADRRLSVVHAHALGRLGALARVAARARGVPFVVTIHGGYRDLPDDVRRELAGRRHPELEYGKVLGALVRARRVVADADAVLTVNAREAELLRDELGPGRVHCLPHGIPMTAYEADARAMAEPLLAPIAGRPYLLQVGRIDPVKNQRFAVEALARLGERHPEAALVLVGAATDHSYDAELRARVAALGLGPHVLFVGPLPPRDPRLVGLLQGASATILPSRSETFGLVVLESWAAGTAVIASRTSGAEQLVRDGEDGLLHAIDDAQGFVSAARRVLERPAEARAMAEAGRRKARTGYDRDALALRVREVYEEARRRRCPT